MGASSDLPARYLVSHLVHRHHNLLVPTPGRVELAHRGTNGRRSLDERAWEVLTRAARRPATRAMCVAAVASVTGDEAGALALVDDLVLAAFLVEPARDFWADHVPALAGDRAAPDLARDRLRWARDLLSQGLWLYPTWLGFPVLQWPTDLIWMQMLLGAVRPRFLVETGLFRGGGAIFYASIFELLGAGEVVSVERTVDPAVRAALAAHPLGRRIEIIEGDAADPAIVAQVSARLGGAGDHIIVLDSDHSAAHVARELAAYAPLVDGRGKLVVLDTSLSLCPEHAASNPHQAVRAFLTAHPEWRISPWAGAGFVTCAEDGILERLPPEDDVATR